jgi:hypothetical protein
MSDLRLAICRVEIEARSEAAKPIVWSNSWRRQFRATGCSNQCRACQLWRVRPAPGVTHPGAPRQFPVAPGLALSSSAPLPVRLNGCSAGGCAPPRPAPGGHVRPQASQPAWGCAPVTAGRRGTPVTVVDPGLTADRVQRDTPDRPRSPDQPRYSLPVRRIRGISPLCERGEARPSRRGLRAEHDTPAEALTTPAFGCGAAPWPIGPVFRVNGCRLPA